MCAWKIQRGAWFGVSVRQSHEGFRCPGGQSMPIHSITVRETEKVSALRTNNFHLIVHMF